MRKTKKGKLARFIARNFMEIILASSIVLYVGIHVYKKNHLDPQLKTVIAAKLGQGTATLPLVPKPH